MSTLWSEFRRRSADWQRAGDIERLSLPALHREAFGYRDSDPERELALYTKGRDEARRLGENWWVLFFEAWRLQALTAGIGDCSRAIPVAMELMVRFNTPEGQAHPFYWSVLRDIVSSYLDVDAFGHREELEQGMAYLDERTPPGPVAERFVQDFTRAEYLRAIEKWQEAYRISHQSLALAERCPDATLRVWHGAWALYNLCIICNQLDRLDELAAHADYMIELSAKGPQLRQTKAEGLIWRAVTQLTNGDVPSARDLFHRGLNLLQTLPNRETMGVDAISRYYESSGNLKAAADVCARALHAATKKGMFHRACLLHVKRCRFLSRAGDLTESELSAAHAAATHLRKPAWYVKELADFKPSDAGGSHE